jgi:hypothetical protein
MGYAASTRRRRCGFLRQNSSHFRVWGLLEHVPVKLNDFSDENMLQIIGFERFSIP